MSGQALLSLLPCKQGLAGSNPRQQGHYCCDGAMSEMIMSGDRVGVFLHVKYGHKGRHTGTYIHTHIHTQGPSVEMPQIINCPPYRWEN